MIPCYIGLGSNLDSPRRHIAQALKELAELPNSRLVSTSPCYRTAPVGPPQPDFINAVARLDTTLAPLSLLDELQTLEQAHQRQRGEHWGPRTLDLDLLLYGQQTLREPRLTVPHPEMPHRAFVLYPLMDIAPNLVLPSGASLESLLSQCPPEGIERIPSERQHRES
ncbi:2-amino-4-hydroxy-6-hydroxymethyldihydropteridine diphosphokinase [Marinimicrobium sp. ARAG 43.8]|uniref:2-amino-4-hydroxy-6- hydroxymethyldihydropteridine diphosphokinase n=1 Tax=Marinimicrobium sp. ARAG 43.8 TaxID=3418719 RepID=UPI003CE959C0